MKKGQTHIEEGEKTKMREDKKGKDRKSSEERVQERWDR